MSAENPKFIEWQEHSSGDQTGSLVGMPDIALFQAYEDDDGIWLFTIITPGPSKNFATFDEAKACAEADLKTFLVQFASAVAALGGLLAPIVSEASIEFDGLHRQDHWDESFLGSPLRELQAMLRPHGVSLEMLSGPKSDYLNLRAISKR